MFGRIQERVHSLLQTTASRLAEIAHLPAIVSQDTDQPSPQARHRAGYSSSITLKEPEFSTDMSASVDTLAEQMLTLVDIVSAQEKDIKALKEQCRRLEDHSQAIMVAFSAFYHVLSVGRVAKPTEVAALLQNISKIAEQEGRPKESVAFLQDLAKMVPGHADA